MKTITIMVGNNQSEYITSLMHEFDILAKERGVRLIFLSGYRVLSDADDINGANEKHKNYQFSAIYDYVNYTGCDACIVCYGSMSGVLGAPTMEEVLEQCQGIPTVMLEAIPSDDSIPFVVADSYESMLSVVRHLTNVHGYKRIAYLSGPQDNYSANLRLKAYRNGMEEAGLEVDESMIGYGDYTTRVHSIVEELLDNNENVEAICCANDNMARACYEVCDKRGHVVGKDIAITGFDDIDISSKLDPALTTVNHDARLFATKALDMALDIADGKAVESIEYPIDLLTRCSCGCKDNHLDNLKGISKYSGILRDHNIDNYNITYDELVGVANSLSLENEKLKSQAWDVSFFVREFIDSTVSTDGFFKELITRLRDAYKDNVYMFINRNSLMDVDSDSTGNSRHMYFAGGFDDDNITVIPHKEWRSHLVSRHKGFSDFLPDTEGNYHAYVLFSSEEQYGLMLCRNDMSDSQFTLLFSLQISNLLRFFKIKRQEEEAKKEMQLSMERVRESNQILSFISRYDELTNILNRRGFMEQALASINRRKGKEAVIMFGDLDHLKEINDCFGHADGDFAIISASKLLTGIMPRDGFCARIGGDEFVAFVPVPNDMTADEKVAKLRDKLKEATFLFNLTCEKPYFVELSAGFHSFVCQDDMDLTKIIASSDEVLYEDKQKRRKSIKKG